MHKHTESLRSHIEIHITYFLRSCGEIVHILEQLWRGYITGVNSNEWEIDSDKQLLYDCKHKKCGNVQCVFYRYVHQNIWSIHLHVLVWLRNVVNIISATILTHDEKLSFLVDGRQNSDRSTPYLHISPEATHLSDVNLCLKYVMPTEN